MRAQAVKALDGYGDEKPEAYRVRLAVLRLSGADLAEIQRHVEGAVEDHEDILAWAESPRQMKCAITNRKLTQKGRDQLSTEDRNDFEKWLRSFPLDTQQ